MMMMKSKRTGCYLVLVLMLAAVHLVKELGFPRVSRGDNGSNTINNGGTSSYASYTSSFRTNNTTTSHHEDDLSVELPAISSSSLSSSSSFHEDLIWGPKEEGATPLFVTPTLNDKTIHLSPHVTRPWVMERFGNNKQRHDDHNNLSAVPQKPKVKILLTNFGWNHPNQTFGLYFRRVIRSRELLQAIVDHPLFDPYGWEDYQSGRKEIDPNVRYYVFLDVETCFESNYPNYGQGAEINMDTQDGRPLQHDDEEEEVDDAKCLNIPACSEIPRALDSPLFKSVSSSRSPPTTAATLVYFDCRGNGPPRSYRSQVRKNSTQLALVSISSGWDQLVPSIDQGLPPPAVSKIILSEQDLHNIIRTCDDERSRPYFLTFVGAYRGGSPRDDLVNLHNASAGIVAMYKGPFRQEFHGQVTYSDMLKQSKYAATPRGDNRFSYRFTEVLAAGAIPVVHSDGWVLPFRTELVNWTKECAIVIPENQANRTIEILQSISKDERCQRRRRCFEIYNKYMATPRGTIDGILQGLELVAEHHQQQPPPKSD